jgi:poly(A) polymerase
MNDMRAAAESIVRRLQSAGHTAYFAGGCVRDELRGEPPHDYDVATSARPEQVEALFPRHSDLVGKSFGVVIVRWDGAMVEVATFRRDGPYRDGRHPDSVEFTTAEEDAHRRDFTVNALFLDPVTGEVHDFVQGREDLERRLLRAVGCAQDRFREDKLRLLRAVRFAANLNFEVEAETWRAVCELAQTIQEISPERIRDELTKWLTGPDPARGLDLLDASGLLREVLPEVAGQKGVEQPPEFHPEGDVFKHVRLMLSQLRNAGDILAWSVLLHDIGKPPTYSVDPTGRIRFNGHETVGAKMAEQRLRALRFSNAQIEQISICIANHMQFKDAPNMRTSTLKKMLARDTFDIELELHRLDCLSSHGGLDIHAFLKERRAALAVEEVRPAPVLRGSDLIALGMAPGPAMGALLREAYDLQLEGTLSDLDTALDWARGRLSDTSSAASS